MSIKISGLDKMQRELKQLEKKIAQVSGPHSVPLDQLLPPAFMHRFTNYDSADEMIEKGGFAIRTPEDFTALPTEEWDRFIATNTQFATWSEMLSVAGNEYIARTLNL